MQTILADYQEERSLFQALLADPCPHRILLLQGESGSGKTTLLTACQPDIPGHIVSIPIQLRGSAVSVAEIFYRLGGQIGWGQFPAFTRQVAHLQQTPAVKIDRNWLAGINNHIAVALQAESQIDRDHRRAALTEAWFNDLGVLPQPLLLILDTYEDATSEVAAWIAGPFLARVARVEQVRVLLAGQKTPDHHNIEWGSCCQWRRLRGVPEPDHWLPIVQALNRDTGAYDPLSWLAGICHVLRGQPKLILEAISSLPERRPGL
jgi:hypothetical protein